MQNILLNDFWIAMKMYHLIGSKHAKLNQDLVWNLQVFYGCVHLCKGEVWHLLKIFLFFYLILSVKSFPYFKVQLWKWTYTHHHTWIVNNFAFFICEKSDQFSYQIKCRIAWMYIIIYTDQMKLSKELYHTQCRERILVSLHFIPL